MSKPRHYSKSDELCLFADQALKALFGKPANSGRSYPAENIDEPILSLAESKQSAAVMRVNHAGEICAQALYQGQALVSRTQSLKEQMQRSAIEEGDHLAWCATRLNELNSRASFFNPLWYSGSLVIGACAGLIGDDWSLGFLAETETQVIKHLQTQLTYLPPQDNKSYKILEQMQIDEAHHREEAIKAGAKELPVMVKKIMRFVSKIMVKTSYWV